MQVTAVSSSMLAQWCGCRVHEPTAARALSSCGCWMTRCAADMAASAHAHMSLTGGTLTLSLCVCVCVCARVRVCVESCADRPCPCSQWTCCWANGMRPAQGWRQLSRPSSRRARRSAPWHAWAAAAAVAVRAQFGKGEACPIWRLRLLLLQRFVLKLQPSPACIIG